MKRHHQYTAVDELDRPGQREVDAAAPAALVKLRDTYDLYARYSPINGPELAFLRAVQTFPSGTTSDQMQVALIRMQSQADRTVA